MRHPLCCFLFLLVIAQPEAICHARTASPPPRPKPARDTIRQVPLLLEQLLDPRYERQVQAEDRLVRLGVPALPALLVALRTRNERELRRLILVVLGRIGPPAVTAVPTLLGLLRDPAVGEGAIVALGRIGRMEAKAVPVLVRMLRDPSFQTRRLAAQALGLYGPRARAAIGPLTQALHERDLHWGKRNLWRDGRARAYADLVYVEVALALARVCQFQARRCPFAIRTLERMMTAPSPSLRDLAKRARGRFKA